jgi:hypothetical protein
VDFSYNGSEKRWNLWSQSISLNKKLWIYKGRRNCQPVRRDKNISMRLQIILDKGRNSLEAEGEGGVA